MGMELASVTATVPTLRRPILCMIMQLWVVFSGVSLMLDLCAEYV